MQRMTSGGTFEDKIGYCRAVVAGGFVHVSGCVHPGPDVPKDVIAQCEGALGVIRKALDDPKYKIEIEVTALAADA